MHSKFRFRKFCFDNSRRLSGVIGGMDKWNALEGDWLWDNISYYDRLVQLKVMDEEDSDNRRRYAGK